MSTSMLEQALIDAEELREAAIKNAEQAIIEKYSTDIKKAVEVILEQEDELGEFPTDDSESPEESNFQKEVPSAHTDDEEMCACPDEDEEIEIDFDELANRLDTEEEKMGTEDMTDREEFGDETLELQEDILKEILEELEDLDEEVEITEDLDEEVVTEARGKEALRLAFLYRVRDAEKSDIIRTFGSQSRLSAKERASLLTAIGEAGAKLALTHLSDEEVQEVLDAANGLRVTPEELEATLRTGFEMLTGSPAPATSTMVREELTEDEVDEGHRSDRKADRDSMLDKYKSQPAAEPAKEPTPLPTSRTDRKADRDKMFAKYKKQMAENKKLNKQLKEVVTEHKEIKKLALKLKDKLNEVNLSNLKLHYTNRILTSDSLNERQKNKVVEAIKKAVSVEETKTIFETLQSTVGTASAKVAPKSLNEVVSKRSSAFLPRRERPSKKDDSFATRMKTLAGIKE